MNSFEMFEFISCRDEIYRGLDTSEVCCIYSSIEWTLYTIYTGCIKKLNKFEIALNFAKRLDKGGRDEVFSLYTLFEYSLVPRRFLA
jgi:hypothetical protein